MNENPIIPPSPEPSTSFSDVSPTPVASKPVTAVAAPVAPVAMPETTVSPAPVTSTPTSLLLTPYSRHDYGNFTWAAWLGIVTGGLNTLLFIRVLSISATPIFILSLLVSVLLVIGAVMLLTAHSVTKVLQSMRLMYVAIGTGIIVSLLLHGSGSGFLPVLCLFMLVRGSSKLFKTGRIDKNNWMIARAVGE